MKLICKGCLGTGYVKFGIPIIISGPSDCKNWRQCCLCFGKPVINVDWVDLIFNPPHFDDRIYEIKN